MGLIGGLLMLPLAPARGLGWVFEQVAAEAEAQYTDPRRIRAELARAEDALEAGEIDEADVHGDRERAAGAALSGGTMAQRRGSSNGKVLYGAGGGASRARADRGDCSAGRPTRSRRSRRTTTTKGWVVTVEVVELERIPPTTNMLASYEAHLDRDGNLVELKRLRRYARNQADQSDGGD